MRKRDSDGASQKKKVKGKKKQAQAEEDAIEVEGSGKKRRQGEEKESGDAKKEDEVQRRALQREIQQLVVRQDRDCMMSARVSISEIRDNKSKVASSVWR